jgi:hypothetical protein
MIATAFVLAGMVFVTWWDESAATREGREVLGVASQ